MCIVIGLALVVVLVLAYLSEKQNDQALVAMTEEWNSLSLEEQIVRGHPLC